MSKTPLYDYFHNRLGATAIVYGLIAALIAVVIVTDVMCIRTGPSSHPVCMGSDVLLTFDGKSWCAKEGMFYAPTMITPSKP